MLSQTQRKGEIAFHRCAVRAAEKGLILSKPMVECRYDAVLDDGQRLIRAQVKYADGRTKSKGAVEVHLQRMSRSASAKRRVYTKDEIDLLLVYVPRINAVVAFPSTIFHGRHALYIRIEAAQNNQRKGVHYAEDYLW